MTKCQRFIIILGGNDRDFANATFYDRIFVLESHTMKLSESKIKLPFRGGCKAVIMENKKENDLLVHGFIKEQMNIYNMNIPFALISSICVWHLTEYIHIIHSEIGNHWRINVDKIIMTY